MEQLAVTARETIEASLASANAYLGVLEQEVQHLEQRVAHLREFIRLGDLFLGTPEPGSVTPVVESSRHPTAVQQAEAILADCGHSMTIADIFAQVVARNGLHGKQLRARGALRDALRDHPKLFHRVRHGVYGLVAWTTSATPVVAD